MGLRHPPPQPVGTPGVMHWGPRPCIWDPAPCYHRPPWGPCFRPATQPPAALPPPTAGSLVPAWDPALCYHCPRPHRPETHCCVCFWLPPCLRGRRWPEGAQPSCPSLTLGARREGAGEGRGEHPGALPPSSPQTGPPARTPCPPHGTNPGGSRTSPCSGVAAPPPVTHLLWRGCQGLWGEKEQLQRPTAQCSRPTLPPPWRVQNLVPTSFPLLLGGQESAPGEDPPPNPVRIQGLVSQHWAGSSPVKLPATRQSSVLAGEGGTLQPLPPSIPGADPSRGQPCCCRYSHG